MQKLTQFIKTHKNQILWLIALILIFAATYIFFANNLGLSAGESLDTQDWLSFWGAFLSFGGSLYLGYVAIQQNKQIIENEQKEFEFSTRPIIECYLASHKLSNETVIVLVAQNIGKSTAYNIQLQISFPETLNQSEFVKYVQRLNQQPFTLAPGSKLKTPLCWGSKRDLLRNSKIEVLGNYEYTSCKKEHRHDMIPKYTFSIDEFDLYNVVDARLE